MLQPAWHRDSHANGTHMANFHCPVQFYNNACSSKVGNHLSIASDGLEEMLQHTVLSECQCKILFQRHM